MTNKYFTYAAPLVAGQTARSGQINSTELGEQTGFDGVQVDMFQAFRTVGRSPAEADMQIPQAPAQCALKVIGFDATGTKAALYAAILNPRGIWTTATVYSRGDLVTQGVEQSLYYCLVNHTSGTFVTDFGAGDWIKVVDNTAAYQASFNPKIITSANSPYTASPGDDLLVDVTVSAVTIVLPPSPVLGDQPIGITHLDGNIVTNNITVSRNGNNIMSLAQDMTVNDTNASLMLGYSDLARGWRLVRGT